MSMKTLEDAVNEFAGNSLDAIAVRRDNNGYISEFSASYLPQFLHLQFRSGMMAELSYNVMYDSYNNFTLENVLSRAELAVDGDTEESIIQLMLNSDPRVLYSKHKGEIQKVSDNLYVLSMDDDKKCRLKFEFYLDFNGTITKLKVAKLENETETYSREIRFDYSHKNEGYLDTILPEDEGKEEEDEADEESMAG